MHIVISGVINDENAVLWQIGKYFFFNPPHIVITIHFLVIVARFLIRLENQ
jgi:hypothetical protein